MLKVKYSCEKCGVKNREVEVPDRQHIMSPEIWLRQVGYHLSRDHDKVSPGCKVTSLNNVFIPIHEGTPIGMKPFH